MKKPPTATQLAKLKRAAKKITGASSATHSEALDQVSRAAGYSDWHEVTQLHKTVDKDDLPVDPPLPRKFDDTPNEERSKKELDRWWLRPFARTNSDGSYEVRCLDGGAWDRSTWYGVAKDLPAARELARAKLARWNEFRDRPMQLGTGESVVMLALTEDRPGLPMAILDVVAHDKWDQAAARWQALTPSDNLARTAAARARAAAVPTFDEVDRLAMGADRIQRMDGAPAAYDEVGACLLLWRWRDANTRTVGCALAEFAHYFARITGQLSDEEAGDLLRRVGGCTVAVKRGTTFTRTPFLESYAIERSAQDVEVLEFRAKVGAFPELERKRTTKEGR